MATTKVTTDVIDMSGNTGGLVWAKGATGDRPTGVTGDMRENTTTGRTEVFNGTAWRNLKEAASPAAVEYLVVAGGGGSGGAGGGGGAGGYLTNFGVSSLSVSSGVPITIEVGSGGAAGTGGSRALGIQGEASIFSTITSTGGGSGAGFNDNASSIMNGGSGGGGANSSASGAYIDGGTATPSPTQGNNGGRGYRTDSGYNACGGGGGAGGNGVDGSGTGTSPVFGSGGAGLANLITGSSATYSTGGRGASETGNSNPPSPAAANTGNGGDQVSSVFMNVNGGAGGSGIVILRCTKATATLGSGITVNSTAGPGSVSGVAISGTSDYYYSATLGTGTITFS